VACSYNATLFLKLSLSVFIAKIGYYLKVGKMRNKYLFKFILILLAIILLYWVYLNRMPYFLEFISQDKKEVVLKLRVYLGDKFTISYIHSYNKTPISETFLIGKNCKIVLKETEYKWQAAGLQDTCPMRGVWGYKNGNIYISEINEKLDNIPLRVGIIADHRLTYRNKTIPFLFFAKGGELISIEVKRHW